ncbi:MAG: ABC transporter ATP-binding protein [Eubacteriales bacterium]|nr:ABC transporter ATP-binding protein [Eubacteriales bacterium]
MSTNITIQHAKKQYGNNTVIPDLNVSIRKGELFTLLGPSGCGKTTLLRMIAGFNSIEGGDFYFGDTRINDMNPGKRNIGMVFQNYAIFPNMTVRKNVEFGLKNRKVPKDEIAKKTEKFLKLVQIDEYADRMPDRLSGGQQQRVALARALIIEPDVLLMDEPLSNLDAKLRVEMRTIIKNIQHDVGITTVYVTHDQEEAMAISDRIAVMHGGVIQHIGTPKNIYQRPSNLFVASFIGRSNLLDGRLLVKDEKTYLCVDGYQTEIRTVAAKHKKSQNVKLSIRPEELLISDDETAAGLKGIVTDAVFLGLNTHYFVKLDNGCDVEIIQESELTVTREIGSRVNLIINTGKVNVFNEDGSVNLLTGVQNDLEGHE